MRIVFVGSGNAATVLARKIKLAGHEIAQVYSRHLYNAEELADELHCQATDDYSKITSDAQLYIVALSDTALYELHNNWHAGNKLVVHTAGAVKKNALQQVSVNYGVFYPLQSLRKERTDYDNFPILVDANSSDNLLLLTDFAESISGTVRHTDDEHRMHLHLAAVIVNNFTNHLYTLAEAYCTSRYVSFSLLKPLILETAERIKEFAPASVQTGPAQRNDLQTIAIHQQLLLNHPLLLALYNQFTQSIQSADTYTPYTHQPF
jgi:predicted short-subunit dehydrogenase-like oxidoreductase (DUF2520 family)